MTSNYSSKRRAVVPELVQEYPESISLLQEKFDK
jgi:hypothetical protein